MSEFLEVMPCLLLLVVILLQYVYLRIKRFDKSFSKVQIAMFHRAGAIMLLLFSLFVLALSAFILISLKLNWEPYTIAIAAEFFWILNWFIHEDKSVGYVANTLIILFLIGISSSGFLLLNL